MKKFKKYLSRFSEIVIFLLVLAVFIFSLYKVVNYVYSVKFAGAKEFSFDWFCPPPCPPPSPPCPPYPPFCPTPTPTPTPSPSPSPEPSPSFPPSASPSPSPSEPPIGGPGPEPGPPVCGASTPNAPTLLSATKSGECADLVWTAVDLATHYSIVYGESSGDYKYGVSDTGNTTSFSVCGLDPASDYCFAVRGVHDCAPSDLSNEICTGEVLGQVLGVTTLADTGSFVDDLFQILFIIGSVCLSLGLRIYLPAKKAV